MNISEMAATLFRNYIAEKSGIIVPPEKNYLFETRLSKMMLDSGTESFVRFYEHLVSGADPALPQKIINSMATNETLWFRDKIPWRVLEERLLPRLVDDLLTGKKSRVRIWSAAASTGQEIYSTVMCVDNYLRKHRIMGVSLNDFEFLATDISSNVLEIARKGRYDRISIMRGMTEEYKQKYFTESGTVWSIIPKIHDAVRFEQFNLQHAYRPFGDFDIIFCRYVLIYFSDALQKEIVQKMYGSLTDNGTFFIGTYALYDLFKDVFTMNDYENLTYYTKKVGL